MSTKVYTIQAHKLLHERDHTHTHTKRSAKATRTHRQTHTGGKLSAAVSTKPQSSHKTVVSTRHNTLEAGHAKASVSGLLARGYKQNMWVLHYTHRHLSLVIQIKERCGDRYNKEPLLNLKTTIVKTCAFIKTYKDYPGRQERESYMC